jgi:hypothetical protein
LLSHLGDAKLPILEILIQTFSLLGLDQVHFRFCLR